MNAHLVRRSLERAINMKLFERDDMDHYKYQKFIESFFSRILDYRQETNWEKVPIDKCQSYLKFPTAVNTETASTANHIRNDRHKSCCMNHIFSRMIYYYQTSYFSISNYQPKSTLVFLNTKEFIENNFECQLLDDSSDLWADIVASDLISGWTYDVVRFKVPYNFSQSGFNRAQYRGFILYAKVIRWNETENDLELERLSLRTYDKKHPNWFFRNTIRFWFCSCRSGQRF